MNYTRIYNELMQSAIGRNLETYTERHRVLPGCMGGTYDQSNVVKLTGREHFIAHWLLYKIHKTSNLAYAWNSMCMIGVGQERVSSKSFQYAREASGRAQSDRISGSNHHMYGKSHSLETRMKISESNKGLVKHSAEDRETRRQWVIEGRTGMLGKLHSDESKLKISESRKGKFGTPVIRMSATEPSKRYSTAGIAMDEGFDSSSIIKCCKGKLKTHKGYTWMYAGED